MRPQASVLHLDLDAFFASVEQRDKPSLRGKPVVVGGVGQRGVVATASYEARVFGIRSAMPAHEARRRCPHAAFLVGRFGAYREASAAVMAVLHAWSPRVEPLSLDEAFVDLLTATRPVDLSTAGPDGAGGRAQGRGGGGHRRAHGECRAGLVEVPGQDRQSELDKPDGCFIVEPGTEVRLLDPMRVGVIPGVGPVSQEKLHRIGVHTVGDLHRVSTDELAQAVGRTHAQALAELAHARDDRAVEPERETKSISVEDTFEHDLVDRAALGAILLAQARQVARRLGEARLFARTVSIKVRRHDFTTLTRSRTLLSATDRVEVIASVSAVTAERGRRDQRRTAARGGGGRPHHGAAGGPVRGRGRGRVRRRLRRHHRAVDDPARRRRAAPRPRAGCPGLDVEHTAYGRGWVWGSGLGRVTVRFETRDTPPGPVLTFATDDPDLRLV